MPNAIVLSGWDEFKQKMNKLPAVVTDEIDGEVEDAIHYWEELAKRDAPVGDGHLRPNITSKTGPEKMEAELTSPVFYSAYVEWGTGARVSVPADLAAYAAQWWTHKVHVGIYPHPFFFVQLPLVEKFLFGNVKKILETEH